jgi:histidine ammonia-lyase
MLSTSNFHVPALALAFDAAAIALAQAPSLAVERVIGVMSPAFPGLPLQLTRHGPANSGFATLQKTLTALWADVRLRANPGSLDFPPVSEGVEDHAPMALAAVEKLAEMLERIRYVIAIEMLVAAQAVDLRGTDRQALGIGPRAAYVLIRETVPALELDRPLGPDVDAIAARIETGDFDTRPGPE